MILRCYVCGILVYASEAAAAKRSQRTDRLSQVRADNCLLECQCCFDDECLPEEMVNCERDNHSYCRQCVRQHADTQAGGMSYCMQSWFPNRKNGRIFNLINLVRLINKGQINKDTISNLAR